MGCRVILYTLRAQILLRHWLYINHLSLLTYLLTYIIDCVQKKRQPYYVSNNSVKINRF